MFEHLRPFASSTRIMRRQAISESLNRLESELGRPIMQLADFVWEAFDEYARRARNHAVKVLSVIIPAVLLLSLTFAKSPEAIKYLGYDYIASYESVFWSGVFFGVFGVIAAAAMISQRFGDLRNVIRLKLPNLYRFDKQVAIDAAKNAVCSTIKAEYDRQMRFAEDFVSAVRNARLEREQWRSEIEQRRLNHWTEVWNVEDAERELRNQIFMESATRVFKSEMHWVAFRLPRPAIEERSIGLDPDATVILRGAAFALFLETKCKRCGTRIRCHEPYQLRNKPGEGLFGPIETREDLPPLGVYISQWQPQLGTDISQGEWLCNNCSAT